MVQPLNYMMAVADPMQRTLEGYRGGIDATTALAQRQAMQEQAAREQEMQPIRVQQAQQDIAMNAQTMGIRTAEEARRAQAFAQQQADAERQRQRQEAFRGALGGLIAKGMSATVDDVASVMGQFPELAGETQAIYNSLSVERQKPLVRSIAQAAVALKSGDTETAKKVANDFASAAEASGDASLAAQARAVSQMIDVDPNLAYSQAAILLQSMDPTLAKTVMGTSARVQRSIPVGDGSVTALVMSDGSTRYQDTATGEVLDDARAQAAISAAERAKIEGAAEEVRQKEQAKADVEAGSAARIEGEKALGRVTVEAATEAFKGLGKVQQNISTLQTAIDAIDRGAKSGAVQKYFPDITAASAELTNSMNRLGLDVISSVTFGALSEGEMKLAMETAVPRNLNEQDLRKWLAGKKAAQEKAADALYNAARYLSRPGNTLNSWLEQNAPQGATSIPQELLDLQARVRDPNYTLTAEDEAIIEKYDQ